MNQTENPYEILGVKEGADECTIKKAYFKLAKKCHPDKQKSEKAREEATTEFTKIADAYDLLSDPVRRYDWRIAHQDSSSQKKIASHSFPARKTQPVVSPMRSSNPPKRFNSNQSNSSPSMPNTKRAFVQPNSARVSVVPVGRPAVARSHMMRPATVRSSVAMPAGHTTPAGHHSGGRSPMRARPSTRNSGGRSPVRNGFGRSQTVQSTIARSTARKPHPLNHTSRPLGPMSRIDQQGLQHFRHPSPGRKKGRGNSIGRKPKNSADAHSDHGPKGGRKSCDRRRRLKKTNSLGSVGPGGQQLLLRLPGDNDCKTQVVWVV